MDSTTVILGIVIFVVATLAPRPTFSIPSF